MNKTERKLRFLFEYQRFEKNPKLEQAINNNLEEKVVELSDDALFGVAGGQTKPVEFDKEGLDGQDNKLK